MQINGNSYSSLYSSVAAQPRQRKSSEIEDLYSKADENGDGRIDQSEISSLLAQMKSSQAESGQNSDDGDRQFGPSEEEIAAIFAEVDSDGDGFLSLDDFAAFGEKMRANGNQPSGAPPSGDPPPVGGSLSGSGVAKSDEEDIAAIFDAADTDGDGKVSLEELIAFQQEMRNNSGTDDASNQSALDALIQMAQTSVDTLTNALTGDANVESSPLSMADILSAFRKNGSEANDFISLIQNIIKEAYQLGQKDSSAATAMTDASVNQA
ncbi:MAG: EF-hand domain-containing protein [Planctomycetota bacterium]|jgi:Ca2+-binding EF-hand superfamily protein|nr:EF-hand domain-containing protein [Planctomycetota bacterium]